jgi:RNA recognition motif-containing protein
MLGVINNGIPQQKIGQNQRNMLQVCDLGENITEGDLEIFFQDFKESIVMIQVNRNGRQTDFNKNCNATIIFKDNNAALNAKNDLNLRKLRGKTIRISFFEKENSARYSNLNNLFIRNIPDTVSPREYYEFFLQFGEISSAKLCEDEDGNHLGYGYLQYSEPESMQRAIENTDGKDVFGNRIQVEHFLRKNERISKGLNENKSIYIKFVSATKENVNEKQIQEAFQKYGKIVYFNSFKDKNLRNFYILTFETEEASNNAKNEMNSQRINNEEIFVDFLMKKSERRRYLISKMNDNNNNLNNTFRYCNLHIRNLPLDLKEEQLHQAFCGFGEIKSIKISKYILVTKVNNVLKEFPTSRGFGYVCFMDKESAENAKNALNEKFLPGFENAKRPLLIEFFMPKSERKNIMNRVNNSRQKQILGNLPFNMPFNPNVNMNQFMKIIKTQAYPSHFHPKMNPIMNPNNNVSIYSNVNNSMVHQVPPQKSVDEPDMNYLNSLEDENNKRDYLGEFIFKSIENHPLTIQRNLTIDEIGKITGMILGIEDIQEIIDISRSQKNLNNRIMEALELLDQNK